MYVCVCVCVCVHREAIESIQAGGVEVLERLQNSDEALYLELTIVLR